jgi:undecaprenyl-diphosphatase
MHRWQVAEDALVSLLPRAQQGSTWFGRAGDMVQQPIVWAALAGALALGGGERGRRAAMRGGVCYGVTGVVANLLIKPLVGRGRPPRSGAGRTGPITSSFPSGHAATDLAFTLAASQEIPLLFAALAPATTAAHWSLVRSRGHYPSDVVVGGLLAVAVVLVAWRVWPPGPSADPEADQETATQEPSAGGTREER